MMYSLRPYERLFVGFLLLAHAAAGTRAADQPDSSRLRVMSFNLRHGDADDGPNHWDKRHALVLKVIRDFDPDLLGTQETVEVQAEYLKEQLKDHTYVGRGRGAKQPSLDEQCGVLFRTARFELKEHGHFWLSASPDVVGSKSWDSSLPRMVTWLRLRDRTTSREFVFANTHFDHRGRVARTKSAQLIKDYVRAWSQDVPVIVAGDFNSAEGSEPYKTMFAEPHGMLIDTFRRAHPDRTENEGTSSRFTGARSSRRIDWIAVTPNWQVHSAAIVRWNQDGQYPSDHYPVTAVLSPK